MTMKELARLAGVSVSTISKAFSKSHEISEAKREHIFKIAREVGCYDKYCKPTFHKKVIGVIAAEFLGDYYSQQLGYLKSEIDKRGGVMIASAYDFDKEAKKEQLAYFTESAKVDGLIILSSMSSNESYSIPIVAIGDSKTTDSIMVSMKSAMIDTVEHLIENGHKNIAFIGEKLTGIKAKGFIEAMEEKGLVVNYDYIKEGRGRFEEAGYNAMNDLLNMENPPTAVVTAYDNIAVGAVKSIYEHGLEIPDDISIIGMDDNRSDTYMKVPLTSITSYLEDLCEIAVDLLFERIENATTGENKKINISRELTKRQSVGKAKEYKK